MISSKKFLALLGILLSFALIAAACGSDSSDEEGTVEPTETTAETTDEGTADHLGDGSLGVVTVEAGEAVQIRSLNAITGDVAFLGLPNERGVLFATEDYGQIRGFDVTMGTGLDDLCSVEGGQAAAQTIVADEQIIGVIGTSCSGAATSASPLISEAGLVMISGSNTSPDLTSDLQGNANKDYQEGYYRTAHNDLFQGAAMADFVFNELGLKTAAAIHDGDAYTQGLSQAFADAFEALGGTITGFTGVSKDDTDMVPVLTEVAAGKPEALFFPIFQPAGDFIADQAKGVAGLERVQLLAADGLLNANFLGLAQSEGMYFSGPDTRFGTNTNQATGASAADFLVRYEADYGEAPAAPFWGHSYDAATLLLEAISAASWVEGDALKIDRAGVREALNAVSNFDGFIGSITCDDFGDCGSQKITVIKHDDSSDPDAGMANVVFEFAPAGSASTDAGHLGDGSLGVVEVEAGEAVQIRSLNAITGDVAFLGLPNERGVLFATEDYGQIRGFDVTMGTGLDDLCSVEGGQAAAQTIVADEQIIGVIGTSCSGAATSASPLISEAGLVMISGSNTSPDLTSDLQGNANKDYQEGYYRTAHNDLFQGAAMADFVFNELGLKTAAAIHDGDAYTQGLSQAFADAFEALGGTITGFTGVSKDDTDMVPVLTEVAAGKPEALFFPIFQPAGDFIADQAKGVAGLERVQLLAADGLLNANFLGLAQSEGMYFSGPDTRFGTNTNQATGASAADFLVRYEADYGEAPAAPFWGHSYDAATLLLEAISAASWVEGDALKIDRAGVREALNAVSNFDGFIGSITCDDFGDCGSQKITVIKHDDSSDPDAGMANVVFEFAP